MIKETKARSVLKSVTWRICATLTTFTLVWIFTGKLDTAIMVGGLEAFIKMAIYFFHERLWIKIKFGKKEIEPFVLWFTGLSGSGKTRLAEEVAQRLEKFSLKVDHLDGKNIRKVLHDTDYTRMSVNDHIMRVGHLASKLEDKGVFVAASFLSPYRESRDFVREICTNFIEIYVATPLEFCEREDIRGLYAKARKGEIKNFPGVDVDYEPPEHPDWVVDLSQKEISDAAYEIVRHCKKYL